MKKPLQVLILLISATISNPMNAHQLSLSDYIPKQPAGWEITGTLKIYTPETLYDYIDGGAELYISYGMKEVASIMFSKDGVGEIRVEIFDMAQTKNAFGVFTHTRTKNELKYGQGSQYFTGAQIFWKDNFFVSVIANDENEEIIQIIESLSSEIDLKIKQSGNIPDIVSFLPENDLVTDGYCYFHHYIWLNSYYYISSDNILNIHENTDAIIAKYGSKNARYFLLLLKYDTPDEAKQAYDNFARNYLNGNSDRFIRNDDGTWQGNELIDTMLVLVFNAPNQESVNNLIKAAIQKISNQNNQ